MRLQLSSLLLVLLLSSLLPGCAALNGTTTGTDGDTYTSRTEGEDGRFTIGAGSKRLMYGYPVPYSTSHFVVSVDGAYASNSPRFSSNVEYMTGKLLSKGQEASAHTEITFKFNDVEITQRLIPVDAQFKDVAVGEWGQYYRIEYTITNRSGSPKKIGLVLLIDTMIDDNDASQMDADGVRVSSQTSFVNNAVPSEVIVYRVAGNKDELSASLVTAKGKAVKPDYMYVGRWPYLHGVVWDVNLADGGYTDSGILLKWDETTVAPGAKRFVATHYGLPRKGQLTLLTNSKSFQRDSTTIYFDLGKSDLSDAAKQSIDALVNNKTISGAFVETYTDARGSEAANLALSKKRAQSVTGYLRGKNVPETVIIPKAYGASMADKSDIAKVQGKQEDRKATIVIFMQ